MGGSEVVVIRVAKNRNNVQPTNEKWTTVNSLKTKPCYIRLNRLPSSISNSSEPVKVPHDQANPEDQVNQEDRVNQVNQENEANHVENSLKSPSKTPEVITIDDASPSQSTPKKSPLKKGIKDLEFLRDPVAQSHILYANCFKDKFKPSPNKDPSLAVFQSLIETHRKQCVKCDSHVVAKVPGVTSLYDPNACKAKLLASTERQLRETQMILKMSEEARAMTDNLYEEKLKMALEEIDTLKRGIQVLMQKDDADSSLDKILKQDGQPILESKERKYHTSCRFNLINMTALRESLAKAQRCGHGNLTILESDDWNHLAAKLAFLCQTCHKETIFYTSGFSSKEPAHFTVNSAALKTLGESAFFKLIDFVKHAPFSTPSKFVGPLITKEYRDNVKLILGLDKFEFDNWTDLSDGNPSKENLDGVIEVHGKDEKRMVKIKNLEPEINLTHDELQNEKSSNCLPILDGLKLDYIKKNPEKNLSLFPELPQKPKITPRPISELLAHPRKAHSPTPALIPINNDNASSQPSLEIVPVKTNNLKDKTPPPLIPSATAQSLAPPPQPILKIKPSKDLPPGSRILSIPPGTKIMCSNVCHSTRKVTGLSAGVYRVIDDKNGEKILIVEDEESAGRKPALVSVMSRMNSDGLASANPHITIPQNVSSSVPAPRVFRKGKSLLAQKIIKPPSAITYKKPISLVTSSFVQAAPTVTSSTTHQFKIPSPLPGNLQPIPVQDLINTLTTASCTMANISTRSLLSNAPSSISVVRTTQSRPSANLITSTLSPESDPLALDGPFVASELANEGDIEMVQSSDNPLIKLVNILPQKTSEQTSSISGNLISFPDKRTLADVGDGDICSIASNAVKRAKIGC